ncbi:reverse transcriptase domain-containing protein [Tanacetum coccineum]
MEKLVLSLGEHNITYHPRTSVKGQILTDFLVENPDDSPPDTSVVETPQQLWTLFTDGSSCVDGSRAGLILTSPEGTEFTYALRFQFTVLGEILKEKSIQEKEVTTVVEEDGLTWMTPIIEYLKERTLPDEKKGCKQTPYQGRTVPNCGASGVPVSMHAGTTICGGQCHNDLGYYWPTMHRDARNVIRACNDCQIHHPVPRNPQQPLTPITAPWPFYKWGIDIAGPFPEGPGKVKFLIVAMDYFTKWIEAKAVSTITGNQVKKFVWDNIVCRFGLPGEIVSDNGKQFSDNPFKDWCEKLNITQRFASVKHPQSNGLVERANRSLEAVIPAEVRMPTYRTAVVDAVHNDEELRLKLDLLEERRERAAISEAKAKLQMTKYHNARVRGVTFRPGDFIYRSNDASHVVAGGKLGPSGRPL